MTFERVGGRGWRDEIVPPFSTETEFTAITYRYFTRLHTHGTLTHSLVQTGWLQMVK